MGVLDRGDIVRLRSVAHEEAAGPRLVMVLTTRDFNFLGDVLCAPITLSTDYARYAGFAVPLSAESSNNRGVVLVNKIRMVRHEDLESRTFSAQRNRS